MSLLLPPPVHAMEEAFEDTSDEEDATDSSASDAGGDTALDRSRGFWDGYFAAEACSAPQSASELATAPRRAAASGKVEWICSHDQLDACHAFDQPGYFALKPTDRILILGCGSSNLGAELYDRGFLHIDSMDLSPVVIATQKAQNAILRPEMRWWVGSCTDMRAEVADASYDVAIDKGTLDTLQFRCASNVMFELVAAMLAEVHRLLTPNGTYVCITTRRRMTPLFQPHFTWQVRRINVSVTDLTERRVQREHIVRQQQEQQLTPSPEATSSKAHPGAFVQLCVKQPTPSPTNGASSSTTFAHNMPKVVMEAQALLEKIEQRKLGSLRHAPTLSRSDLDSLFRAALVNQPDLACGQSAGVPVTFDAIVDHKRTLGSKLCIYVVRVAPVDIDVAAASTASSSTEVPPPAAAGVAPPSSVSVIADADLDRLELISPIENYCLEDGAPESALAIASAGDNLNASSPSHAQLSAFAAAHALIRASDTIRVRGVIGRSRAGRMVVFVSVAELREVGAARLLALQQRASYHNFNQA